MGWETRKGRSYYYRKERTPDGRVRSVYLGSGDVCRVLSECDRGRRIEAEANRTRLRRALAPLDDALDALRTAEAELRTLRDAYLVATGHRTHRGQWRRRRGFHAAPFVLSESLDRPEGADLMARRKKPAPVEPMEPGTGLSSPLTGTVFVVPDDASEAARLRLAKAAACTADKPTHDHVTELRVALSKLPPSAFRPFADRVALRSVAVTLAGGTNASAALAEAEAERFAAELVRDDDGPLVRAAAGVAALARLVLDTVTERHARLVRGSYSITEAEHVEKRLNAAHTRYLRSLATVAALRKAEGTERERAAKMEREAHAEPARRPLDLADFLPPPSAPVATPRQLPRHAGDSAPAPADVELVTG